MVDFGTLTVGVGSQDDLKRAAANGKYQNHPVLSVLAASYAEKDASGVGTPRYYDVAESDVDEIESAVRGCAMVLDIGYRFVPKALKDESGQPIRDAAGNPMIRCNFAGKNKKVKLTPEQRAERDAALQAKRDQRKAQREQRERDAEAAKAAKEAEKANKPRPTRATRKRV
jgi:hypothetical protein